MATKRLKQHNQAPRMASMPKAFGRASSHARGYDRTWQKLRLMVLRANPVCKCGKAAQDVDHIQPIRLRPDLRLTVENLQALCRACHRKKHQEATGG